MYETPDRTQFGDVGNFHQKFNLPVSKGSPQNVDTELLIFRAKFLLEELTEFIMGAGLRFEPEFDPDEPHEIIGMNIVPSANNPENMPPIDHAQTFDALIDMVYVAFGTAHLFGYPWHEGWGLVQAANMTKVRAQSDGSDSKRGSSFDVVKPEGWRAPDIDGLLWLRGWRRDRQCTICHKWFHGFDNITPINSTQGHEQIAHLHCAQKEGHVK